jgi:hypothetical protein
MVMIFLSVLSLSGYARPSHPLLVEMVRQSQRIDQGTVTGTGEKIQIEVKNALKGPRPEPPILSLDWSKYDSVEEHPPKLSVGDEVLVFLAEDGQLLAGYDGLIKVNAKSATPEAVRMILDSASAGAAREQVLLRMIESDNSEAKRAALQIIYLETDRNAGALKTLAPNIIKESKSSDARVSMAATQALGRIATKDEIPALIDLVASKHKHVASTANNILIHRTGVKIELGTNAGDPDRGKTAEKWRTWWGRHKAEVNLRK